MKPVFKRILLKLSGEALLGNQPYGISQDATRVVAEEIKEIWGWGVEVIVVIGAGNIYRGAQGEQGGMERSTADYMGMLATILNCLSLQDALEKVEVPTRVLSAIAIPEIGEKYIRRRALRHLGKNRVVICAGGTGNPYFTTDSCAALRGVELGCEVLLKATKVDGVYDRDPVKFDDAQHFDQISYDYVLEHDLQVMDQTAIAMCRENRLKIIVFDFFNRNSLSKVLAGETIGTVVS